MSQTQWDVPHRTQFKPLPALSKLRPVQTWSVVFKKQFDHVYIKWVVITNMDILLIFLFKQYKDWIVSWRNAWSSYCLRIAALNQTKATEMLFTARLIKTRRQVHSWTICSELWECQIPQPWALCRSRVWISDTRWMLFKTTWNFGASFLQ